MNILTRYEQDGFQVFITPEGEVSITQRAMARLCEINESSLRRFLDARKIACDKTTAKVEQGFGNARSYRTVTRVVSLYTEDAVTQAMEHFCPEKLRKMAMVGLRLGLQQLVGWKPPLTYDEQMVIDKRFAKEFLYHSANQMMLSGNPELMAWIRVYMQREMPLEWKIISTDGASVRNRTVTSDIFYRIEGKLRKLLGQRKLAGRD